MCTAITYQTKDNYFGRTLDYEMSYHEEVTVTPRNFSFHFRRMGLMETHYAMIGIAFVINDYPLYYDATNEKGLSMAGLNFVKYADYKEEMVDKDNIAPFEFIPWLLGQCATVREARALLQKINIAAINFSKDLPFAKLHWLIADREESITVEAVHEGLKVYDNPAGVLTNDPTFDIQIFNLNNYIQLSPGEPENHFSKKLNLRAYSRGMGAIGLPGDWSSMSRFVRVAFTKLNSISGDTEEESVSQFFHILESVSQQRGSVDLGEGKYAVTIYTSCCNTNRGIYYYTTYDNHQITGIDMHRENLDGALLIRYPLIKKEQIKLQNE